MFNFVSLWSKEIILARPNSKYFTSAKSDEEKIARLLYGPPLLPDGLLEVSLHGGLLGALLPELWSTSVISSWSSSSAEASTTSLSSSLCSPDVHADTFCNRKKQDMPFCVNDSNYMIWVCSWPCDLCPYKELYWVLSSGKDEVLNSWEQLTHTTMTSTEQLARVRKQWNDEWDIEKRYLRVKKLQVQAVIKLVFAARCKRGLSRHAVSVRLSVMFVHSVETNKHIFKISSPAGNHTISVFPYIRNGMAIFRRVRRMQVG